MSQPTSDVVRLLSQLSMYGMFDFPTVKEMPKMVTSSAWVVGEYTRNSDTKCIERMSIVLSVQSKWFTPEKVVTIEYFYLHGMQSWVMEAYGECSELDLSSEFILTIVEDKLIPLFNRAASLLDSHILT